MCIQCICVSPDCIEHVSNNQYTHVEAVYLYIYILYAFLVVDNYIFVFLFPLSLSLYADIYIRMCQCAHYAYVCIYITYA